MLCIKRFVSGLIFYTVYVDAFSENMVAVWASLVYNMTYIVPELIATLVVVSIPAVKRALAQVQRMALEA